MSPRLSRGLGVASLAIGIVTACGGSTSRDPTNTTVGAVGGGGAHPDGGTGGEVSTAGQTGGGSGGQTGGGTGGDLDGGGPAGTGGSTSDGGTGGIGPAPILFGVLDLERELIGHCMDRGQIIRASIIFTETGDYWMSGVRFVDWDWGRPDACWGVCTPDCVEVESFERMLSEPQVDELATLLAALPEDRCDLDPTLACDPGLVTTLGFGSSPTHSDYCCGTQLSPGYAEAIGELVGFLDSLAVNLPCTVSDDECNCLSGVDPLVGTTDACRDEWSCCIFIPTYTATLDFACNCTNVSEAECVEQLTADPSMGSVERLETCPPP